MAVKDQKDQIMVAHGDAVPEQAGEGVVRRVLAYTDELM